MSGETKFIWEPGDGRRRVDNRGVRRGRSREMREAGPPCIRCGKKKIKCDRGSPCDQCSKRGKKCTPKTVTTNGGKNIDKASNKAFDNAFDNASDEDSDEDSYDKDPLGQVMQRRKMLMEKIKIKWLNFLIKSINIPFIELLYIVYIYSNI